MPTRDEPLTRLRAICMALPQVTERLSHGSPTWFVRDMSTFVTLMADGHHDDEFGASVVRGSTRRTAELIASAPEKYFRPPYVGGRGWIGLRLDVDVDWAEIAEVVEDAYRAVAPKRLLAELDGITGSA